MLLGSDGRVRGVTAEDPDSALEIDADLVVACDGRHSTLREAAGMDVQSLGAPMDVLWFRLPREQADIDHTYAAPAHGRMLVMLDRNDAWQCAYLIRKGSGDTLRAQPLQAFRDLVAPLLPFGATRMQAVSSWDDVKLLEVHVDRLQRWHRDGLLLIGDAAHAMSPVGGVGINLAIQDAVAAANLLGSALLRLASRFRLLRSIPARLFGYGIRRERVRFGRDPR